MLQSEDLVEKEKKVYIKVCISRFMLMVIIYNNNNSFLFLRLWIIIVITSLIIRLIEIDIAPLKMLFCNTRVYNFISGPHITHFSAVVAKKRKNFEKMFVLKRANIACRQQMTSVNLLQKHFKQLSYYSVSNRYYILTQLLSVIKSNIIYQQIEGNFWICSMAFTGMLCLQIYYGLFVVERAFTKNSRKAGTWPFGASLWKIIKALWLVKYSSKFIFTDSRSWNSECPGLWYALVFELTS